MAVPVAYGTGHAALPNPLGNGAHQIACATSFKSGGNSLRIATDQVPSTDRILETFAPLQRHLLSKAGRVVQRFDLELTDLQRKLLDFLGINPKGFRNV
ncbi:MAG TPA: hypothetical protein VMT79_08155 [Candidatus Binatia bacterium]|nr:hypothetical protein [Candidatus Binatia bacterium]